jgi:uncharacterized protein
MLLHKIKATQAPIANRRPLPTAVPDLSRVFALTNSDMEETLAFLKVRPVHTVVMTSFINDNGIESDLNRGTFYAYRNKRGALEGVALIGHTTLVEARSAESLQALAFTARKSSKPIHIVMSEADDAERFWSYYSGGAREPRLTCTELLFELSFPFLVQDCEWELRKATEAELEQAAEAQAAIALLESGVDPMERDPEGFKKRVLRRIEQGRIFVVVENGKVIFKADIIAETDDVAYLEGVYVAPEYRGQGIGSRCLAKLGLELLGRVERVCLLSNEEFTGAHRSYYRAGFKSTGKCTTLFA